MSDSDEPITREKKPLSEARLAAIERMKEGRRRSLEAKKKLKEEEKEAKKQMKKKIKMRVEEEMNGLSSLPTDDKEFMEDLRKKAVSEVKIDESKNEILDEQPFSSPSEPQSEVKDEIEEVIEIKQPVKKPQNATRQTRGRPKKKKVIVNNYYEDESSDSEEEIVNNYHKKKRKKKKPVKKVESSSESEEEEEVYNDKLYPEPEPQIEYEEKDYINLRRNNLYRPPNAMSGINFR